MAVDRQMSKRTWEKIDGLLRNIALRAAKIKDNDTYREADMAVALLRNLSMEIKMEDEKANRELN